MIIFSCVRDFSPGSFFNGLFGATRLACARILTVFVVHPHRGRHVYAAHLGGFTSPSCLALAFMTFSLGQVAAMVGPHSAIKIASFTCCEVLGSSDGGEAAALRAVAAGWGRTGEQLMRRLPMITPRSGQFLIAFSSSSSSAAGWNSSGVRRQAYDVGSSSDRALFRWPQARQDGVQPAALLLSGAALASPADVPRVERKPRDDRRGRRGRAISLGAHDAATRGGRLSHKLIPSFATRTFSGSVVLPG